MDNLCHTLAGAALAEAGLKRRTASGAATLMIAANFPDIDVASLLFGSGLGARRGITHGVPALIVLPFVLTGLMIGWHRLRGRASPPPAIGQLLILSAIGILSHPVLDWMNTYGMRWWLPFDGTWSYGDALFIVDPWIWLALGIGIFMSRLRARTGSATSARTPARVALVTVTAYIALMIGVTTSARRLVAAELSGRGISPSELVVDPVPVNPLARRVIYEWNGAWHFADFRWMPPARLGTPHHSIVRNDTLVAVTEAAATPLGAEFLSWSRLPFFSVEAGDSGTSVFMGDARYTLGVGPSWASVRVFLPAAPGLPPG